MIYHYIIIGLGLLSSVILFFKFPFLKKNIAKQVTYTLSIVIPARNEEKNLPLLLEDLKHQKNYISEIICVDDGSTDHTYEVAKSFGINVISILDKPSDWTGKAWACQKGADIASGELILFLDADVRLHSHAISNLLYTYHENKCVISVQPYHETKKYYEQFSFFFNLIEIAANGLSMAFKSKNIGLFGPVILIDKKTYTKIDGHLAAQKSVVDDIVLGEKLKQRGLQFKLFIGGKDISFRMYSNNFKSLIQGWVKNYATGAIKTPLLILVLVSLWIASCITTLVLMIVSIITQHILIILIAIGIYICWIFEFFRISHKIGKFKIITPIVFPLYLLFFIVIFLISLYKKKFQMNVIWKDRKIKLD